MICEAVTPCNQADRYAEAEISNMRRMDPGLKPASTTDAAANKAESLRRRHTTAVGTHCMQQYTADAGVTLKETGEERRDSSS